MQSITYLEVRRTRLRRVWLTVVIVMVSFGACGDGGYPDEAVTTFLEDCRAQPNVTDSFCRCSIAAIQEEMSYEEYQRLQGQTKESGELSPQFLEVAERCVDELDLPTPDA